MIGPTYRADMWAALEADPDLSAAELARRTYGSFATAWHVRRDFALVASSSTTSRRGGSGGATRRLGRRPKARRVGTRLSSTLGQQLTDSGVFGTWVSVDPGRVDAEPGDKDGEHPKVALLHALDGREEQGVLDVRI